MQASTDLGSRLKSDLDRQPWRRVLSDEELEELRDVTRKRACSVGGGMSHHCAASFIDQRLRFRDRLLHGEGPGKRSEGPGKRSEGSGKSLSVLPDQTGEDYSDKMEDFSGKDLTQQPVEVDLDNGVKEDNYYTPDTYSNIGYWVYS